MKKRVLVPLKILAVGMTALACTNSASPDPVKAPVVPSTTASAAPAGEPVAPAPAATEAASPPIDAKDPRINTLRAELARDKNALGRVEHYRPLCDKDGYPIVGNLNQKAPTAFQPSEVCEAIRKKSAR